MDGWIDGWMDGWMDARGLCALKENVTEHHPIKSLEVILKGGKNKGQTGNHIWD